MKYVRITEKVSFIEAEGRGRYPYSNSMLIDDDVRALIDTGMGRDLAMEIAKDKKIDLVINSHGHEDHVASNNLFKEAKICSHRFDAPIIRSVDKLKELYGSTEIEAKKLIDSLLDEHFRLRDSRVDLEFEDDHIFDLGTTKLEVIHTPGHSRGHCCFSIPSERLIFLADVDLSSFGPWYGCLDGDIGQFIKSIERVRELQFELAVTSHKGIVRGREIIEGKLSEYLNRIFEREERLLEFLTQERSLDEIVNRAIIYGHFAEPKAVFRLFERTMIEEHLKRLVEKNLVAHTDRGFKATR
jgi:glyoxylase-like metal-dependent hydrolase (beta-lactamase superfamily II)